MTAATTAAGSALWGLRRFQREPPVAAESSTLTHEKLLPESCTARAASAGGIESASAPVHTAETTWRTTVGASGAVGSATPLV